MDAKEIFARTIRPLTHKSPAAAVVAFILDKLGNVLCHSDGEPGALEALRREAMGSVSELEKEFKELEAELEAEREKVKARDLDLVERAGQVETLEAELVAAAERAGKLEAELAAAKKNHGGKSAGKAG